MAIITAVTGGDAEAHGTETPAALVCLSHLRWDFVYQRPQHLLGRAARERRVFFVEEPVWDVGPARFEVGARPEGVRVAVPHLPESCVGEAAEREQRRLLDELLREEGVYDFVLWYYTPMALGFSDHLQPLATVYDCMDELSLFRGAPPALVEREAALLRRADLVFTGGPSLFQAKRGRHPDVHCFPSSIDRAHFERARTPAPDPAEQAPLTRPRLGFFGVIDERMDTELVAAVADARPEWQLVMIGPVVKIDPAELPRRSNLHYLGSRPYGELPAYIAGWDVALMPWARNESTRFISPTKTPEYLAAGCPVVSTPIADVMSPYGEQGLVHVADGADAFVRACEAALALRGAERARWLAQVDEFLAHTSWDATWAAMRREIDAVLGSRRAGEHTRAEQASAYPAPSNRACVAAD